MVKLIITYYGVYRCIHFKENLPAPDSMQFVHLPKLTLHFKKVFNPNQINIPINFSNQIRINFNELIPDKVSKQVERMKRSQAKESSTDINLRNGDVLKMSSLSNMKNNASSRINLNDNSDKTSYSLRKIRIESAISTELINFFSSSSVPKLLRNDFSIWSIDNVFIWVHM